ncbi:hypothetical protein V8D89_012959 [Ganoderma adspersum]
MFNDLDVEQHLQGYEILQKPYTKGLLKGKAPAQSIPYGPGGFTVATVLDDNLTQISDADGALPTDEGQSWPEKMVFHFEFAHPAYDAPVRTKQFRVPKTKGAFAILAVREIQSMLAQLPQLPFRLDQIRVVRIEICSRGTVQLRIFVDGFMLPPEELDDLVERLHG